MNKNQSLGVYIIGIIIILLVGIMVFSGPTTVSSDVSYSEFLKKVEAHEIKSVEIGKGILIAVPFDNKIKAKEGTSAEKINTTIFPLTNETIPMPTKQYKVAIPDNNTSYLAVLEANNVLIEYKKPTEGGLFGGLWSLIMPIFFIILIILIIKGIQQGGSAAMSFGKSKAKMVVDKTKVTFKDVAGIDEERQELEEVVDFLKNGEKYIQIGAKIPTGILLIGPPGVGKTLMARAVAGEAGVPFFTISGSDFVEMFVGVGASRVRDLFEQAKKQNAAIIFIDEIDAVGRKRGSGQGGGHDEREQTLNQLLVEMDGFDENAQVIVLAATNRPDILDTALLRPGRFDRQIYVNNLDIKGREEVLKIHSKNKQFENDIDLKIIAKRTSGFSGADLKNLLNEAALLAARHNKVKISMDDINDATDRVYAGIEKRSKVMTDEDKEITSYHEVGHALVIKLLELEDELHKVSIIPRGSALGLTWSRPTEKVHCSKKRLLGSIAKSLGGRAAEEIVYGAENVSTGASHDLLGVADTARKMVAAWGMSEKIGNLAYDKNQEYYYYQQREYSDKVAYEIDMEIKRIVDEQYAVVKKLLEDNRDMMDKLARELLERETLDEAEFTEIMNKVKEQRQEQGHG